MRSGTSWMFTETLMSINLLRPLSPVLYLQAAPAVYAQCQCADDECCEDYRSAWIRASAQFGRRR